MPLAPSQPAVQLFDSDSDVDDDDQMVEEDEEEEEVEKDVEEEEPEEEEQESEEEEEVDDVEGEEVDRVEADDDHKDVRQDVKSVEHYGRLELGSSTQGKFRNMLPSNAFGVDQSSFGSKKETLNIQSEGLRIKPGRYLSLGENKGILLDNMKDAQTLTDKNSSKSCIEHHSNSNSYLCKSEIMSAKTTNSCHVTGKGAVVAIQMRDCFGKEANDVWDPEDEIKQTDKQSGDDEKQAASRIFRLASEIGTQSLSSGAGIDNGDKRPAIVCDFFAKGWCIKGSMCRFLHRKDNLNNTHAQDEGVAFAANRKDVQLDEGVRGSTDFHDPIAPLVGINSAFPLHLTSEGIQKLERIVSERSIQFPEERDCFALHKEILSVGTCPDAKQMASASGYPVLSPLFEDVERQSKRQHWPTNDCGSHLLLANRSGSVFRNSLHPEYGFSSSGYTITADKYGIGKLSSHSTSLEELASSRSCRPSLSHSPNSISSNHLLGTGMLSCNSISSGNGLPPFSYSSLYASSLRSSSFLRSSPISCSELDNLPSTSISLPSAELKSKISSDDWEPSVPFRPSFFIPPAISSPRSQYDPLRDSFELPKLGDVSLKAFYCQGSSKMNASNQQTFGDSVTGTVGLSSNEDINSVSSHNIRSENVLNKSCHTHEKDMPANEAKALGMSVGSQNEALSKEENALDLSDVEDNINMNKISEHCDSRHQRDGSRQVKDLKVDRVGQNKEEEVDCIMGENMHKELKPMRHFRAALVDLVKELLKPKWREGNLRKDAHNKIVRKAVEKVLSSLQHQQIPSTTESVKQYLSSSRLKINKLVEGYADKYGKT
ncbi:protein FRIGIDA-ESSENTIAL 1 isoform X1 [Ziziphus jujuba]|uniref:Protein FRIGIDA-ESSENTIAL 1 isoform X1 n=2 Tax=Ziziphus jujuba TaxID=326968 RepID=A0ABM3IKC1_ZIZJJ|nr:protein FRIGIDA-ESSENTIAL 1 isoform X1 [Ziziphus jujuba]